MSRLLYRDEECNTFVREMERDGRWELRHYSGRFYWEGPAVFCDKSEYQDVARSTSVRVQTDECGKSGMVVYPVSHGGRPLETQEDAPPGSGAATGGETVAEAPGGRPGLRAGERSG